MKYILGIDIGTSTTKAVAYTTTGKVIAHHSVASNHSTDRSGYHEADPRQLLDAVITVIIDAVIQAGEAPAAISFSAAMHGIMAVDEQGVPLTDILTWADLRSNGYALKLRNSRTGKKLYERTGTPVHPMSPLCKLMWMKEQLPDVFERAHKFISIKEYIFFHFFGEFIVDHSIASATGLFDIYTLKWNAAALHTAGISDKKLSRHVSSSYIIRGLKNEYPVRLNIHRETPFVIGGSDGCLAHLGSNALQQGAVSLTIGTSGAVRMMMSTPVRDPEQRLFNYLLSDGLYIAGGPVNNGGNVVQWFINNMSGKSPDSGYGFDWFIGEAMKMEPGSGGLIFLPYIYGERAPVWDAEARGIFYGIDGRHRQEHFMRAILEGISFALRGILETLEELIVPATAIYVSGGFIQSKPWVQLLADVLGKKLLVTGSEDASAAGAAIIGMSALGWITSITEAGSFFTIGEVYEPDLRKHELYKENYHVYGQLYDSIKTIKK